MLVDDTTEPVVVHRGREAGSTRAARVAAGCCNGLLAGSRYLTPNEGIARSAARSENAIESLSFIALDLELVDARKHRLGKRTCLVSA